MKILAFFVCSLAVAQALECGIVRQIDNDFKKIITSCLKMNATLDKVFDFSSLTSKETSAKPKKIDNTTTPEVNTTQIEENLNRTSRAIRISPIAFIETTTTEPETETETVTDEGLIEEPPEKCVLQCILSNLNLTDDKGFPVHEKVVQGLLKGANGRELQDFLEDSTDSCFQKINDDTTKNSCEFSLDLVRCLADFGRTNCGDWPAGDISLLN